MASIGPEDVSWRVSGHRKLSWASAGGAFFKRLARPRDRCSACIQGQPVDVLSPCACQLDDF